MDRRLLYAVILLVPLLCARASYSHDAPLDGFGCHVSANQQAYECHRGLLASQTFPSKTEMLHALEGTRPPRDSNGDRAELTLHPNKKDPEQVCIRENFTKQVLCGTLLR